MGALRQVQILRLRSTQASLLQRGAILLEDALRTASLPGTDGSRLLIVRRMSLGSFCADWPPASVAMLIEKRFQQLGAYAVHAEDPLAANASAVYFRDEVEPYLCLAVRIALGMDTGAWFWKLAVSDWQPEMSREESLHSLLYSILRTGPGCLAVLRLVKALLQAQALERLLSALEVPDGPALLQVFGWSVPAFSSFSRRCDDDQAMLSGGFSKMQVLANFCAQWGAEDDRSRWLASILLVTARPALHRSTRLPRYAKLLIDLAQRGTAAHFKLSHLELEDDADTLGPGANRRKDAGAAPLMAENGELHGLELTVDPTCPGGEVVSGRQTLEDVTLAGREPLQRATSRVGLFFLLAVMERVGLPQWLEENPETTGSNFPAQILRTIAQRLKTPADDPVWLALDEVDQPAPADVVAFWLSRLRAFCRRSARIGLHSLVCRGGRISVTPTHLDVYLPASDADVRVRRAGLDFDLGWVPWFGRVVHFHYLSLGEFSG
jgi:hypothetical protein